MGIILTFIVILTVTKGKCWNNSASQAVSAETKTRQYIGSGALPQFSAFELLFQIQALQFYLISIWQQYTYYLESNVRTKIQ